MQFVTKKEQRIKKKFLKNIKRNFLLNLEKKFPTQCFSCWKRLWWKFVILSACLWMVLTVLWRLRSTKHAWPMTKQKINSQAECFFFDILFFLRRMLRKIKNLLQFGRTFLCWAFIVFLRHTQYSQDQPGGWCHPHPHKTYFYHELLSGKSFLYSGILV